MTNTCTIAGTSVVCSMMKSNESTVGYNQCSVDGCCYKKLAFNFCSTHYWRYKKTGNPLLGGFRKTIIILNKDYALVSIMGGVWAKIDLDDSSLVGTYSWHITNGYALNNKIGLMH